MNELLFQNSDHLGGSTNSGMLRSTACCGGIRRCRYGRRLMRRGHLSGTVGPLGQSRKGCCGRTRFTKRMCALGGYRECGLDTSLGGYMLPSRESLNNRLGQQCCYLRANFLHVGSGFRRGVPQMFQLSPKNILVGKLRVIAPGGCLSTVHRQSDRGRCG